MKPTEHDLDWLAFRYVSGELAADEAESFELRLANDQAACDAVANAVELSQAIVAIESLVPAVTPATASRIWSTYAAWFATGTAACLLVVLALNSAGSRLEPSVSPALVTRWSEGLDLTLGEEESLEMLSRESDDGDETLASDWMVEAVRSLHAKAADGDDPEPSDEMET